MPQPLLSIIIPVYNEEECFHALWERLSGLSSLITTHTIEYVFINDGSKDKSAHLLDTLANQTPSVKVLHFSRNFGHQLAITAGMDYAKGDLVAIIDADLQDPPELIKDMIDLHHTGYDVVYGKRKDRKGESLFKRGTASLFYRFLNSISEIQIPLDTGDFRLMSRRVVNALSSLKERDRFVRGMVSWVGFPQTSLEFERDARYSGETKYPLTKMIRFAVDGIISFSHIPLRAATWFGFLVSGIVTLYILYVVIIKFLGLAVPGWSSLIIAVLFLGGIQLITIGILGEYLGRLYAQSKQRPLYIVADTKNITPPSSHS